MSSSLRIIVSGLVGLQPVGGMAWHYLQYLIGLSRLGHDVYYHEDTWCWPYNPVKRTYTSDGRYSARYIASFINRYEPKLLDRWHYVNLHCESFGMDRRAFEEVARTADLFLNVSGACIIPDTLSADCVTVFLDTDPGYNQIVLSERFDWSENVDRWCASVAAHDQHFTFAENIHDPDCLIPGQGFDWKVTRMPIALDLWEPLARQRVKASAPWTTVMTWNAFRGPLIYEGVEYKSKGAEFEKIMALPGDAGVLLEVAIGGVDAPVEKLASAGWQVVDGPMSTLSPEQYQRFIARSRGEFSVAKHVYVAMRSGWFSERTACYLAAGRPVVVQDTGFSRVLPTGEGLLTFTVLAEALSAFREIEADYARHSKAALAVARECFDSEKVLEKLIEDAMAGT